MTDTVTSRLAGFHKLGMEERRAKLEKMLGWELDGEGLGQDVANQMIENAVGTFGLPLGIGLNLQVNGKDYLVPMVVEEPSVVAAVSFAAKIVRESGGFIGEADPPLMVGQIQLSRYGDPSEAVAKIEAHREDILRLANSFHPQMTRRGGGAKDMEVRLLPAPEGPKGEPILVVHLILDTQEAMGANLINTVAEGVAPLLEHITGGRVYLRILSNLADRRLARSTCRIPFAQLADFNIAGEDIAEGIAQASRFAQADPYRAATHNKGIMNGVDAVAIATGQDWRAIEAGAHAFAARGGHYRPLSTWTLEEGHLVGRAELPLALGTVGGPIKLHPQVQMCLKMMRVSSARELAGVFASVGLAQNLAALRALGSIGIQKGHMALHARSVAAAAGAKGAWVEKIARQLVSQGHVKLDRAKDLIAALSPEDFAQATGAL